MNHREPTSEPKGPGRTFPCLALLLLPLLSGVSASARPLLPVQAGLTHPKPYLVALGSPSLRFQDPAPAAGLATRPPKPGAPRPSAPDVSAENLASSLAPLSELPSPSSTDSPISNSLDGNDPSATESSSSTPTRTPRPILPDEMRPQARPEDFLPFFQIPAAQSGDVSVFVPVPRAPAAPASLPLSSATYTQTPR
jgi:hypothetical protein